MKGFLQPHHIAHVDMQGRVVDGGPSPSSEVGIHFVAYEERSDVRAVCHAHPPHAVAMTVAGIDMQMPIIPEAVVSIGGIPTAPFGIPGTPDLGETIREIVRCWRVADNTECQGSSLLEVFWQNELDCCYCTF